MSKYFDNLETRSAQQRAQDIATRLPVQIKLAGTLPGYAGRFKNLDLAKITSPEALAELPVLRKADLVRAQQDHPPLGGFTGNLTGFSHIFQSPGPIYEPGQITAHDWWRFGRFLHSLNIGAQDVVQNCFGYHLTPAGIMFESGARAVGATVLPAGTGQTDLQVQAAKAVGSTTYVGTPDYLKIILERADEQGVELSITKAGVSGGALFPSLRSWYEDRGITVGQCYATADIGHIAMETIAGEGMVVDEGCIIEIVTPGTGNPVPQGEVGEVLVTTLNPDYPLIRFATGDLSAIMPGNSPCGRTNMRIKGWMGRADQTTKIKGMFVRPEQVAALVAALDGVSHARVIAERKAENDVMIVQIEGEADRDAVNAAVSSHLKMRARIEVVDKLPRDGIVIEDRRTYD